MPYGVTSSGFNAKRLEDIAAETLAAWRAKFGDGFDLDANSPEGQIKLILDERFSLLWEILEAVYESQYPALSEGVNLDNVAALTGLTRIAARKSTVDSGRGYGTATTVVPLGTIVSVSGNESARFVTDADSTIAAAIAEITEIIAVADVAGSLDGTYFILYDEDGSVAFWIDVDDSGTAEPSHGADRSIEITTIATGDSASIVGGKLQVAIDADSKFGATNVNETVTATNAAAGDVNNATAGTSGFAVTTTTNGENARTPLINLTAEVTGAMAAPAASLTVIETPVVGLDTFTNELDADLGRDIETDADFKLRRERDLQLAGAATPDAIRVDLLEVQDVEAVVVFFNNTDTVDGEGRIPHSVDIVVQAGDEDDIAVEIFATVAAGIGFNGDITKNVTDSQGFTQEIKFSRPSEIAIYLEVDLTVTGSFPADGLTQAVNAVLAYGLTLTIGEDVIVYGTDSLINVFNDIAGITDIAIRIGTAPGPTLDDNIVIAAREIADFDSSRITITTV